MNISGTRVFVDSVGVQRADFAGCSLFWVTPRGVQGVVKDIHENKGVAGARVCVQLLKSLKGKDLVGEVR
jgi:hypothetical protein